MSTLFEYGGWITISNPAELKSYLKDIWQQRILNEEEDVEFSEDQDSRYQPFLQFDGNKIRGKNYIGFIQNGFDIVEIYPKVFRNLPEVSKNLMLRHVFYWFSYCRKWRFPFTQTSLESNDIDTFPELIVYLMASQFLETVSARPLMQYQICEESMTTPRGAINMSRYINLGLSRGNFHKLECDHEPFLFDNQVNRVIKYCSRLLLPQTRLSENQRLLQQTIFTLDEVEDVPCDLHSIETISLNAFYDDYALVIGMCKTIIQQQIYSNNLYDMTQWCLLFPMEYIFEDFVAGFLDRHFSSKWRVEYQKSDKYLSDTPRAFNLQHDIFLTDRINGRKIIVDTKYKIRDSDFKKDLKKGIAQPDLYQVTAYALKRGCTDVFLIFPNTGETCNDRDDFIINSGFDGVPPIKITVLDIPFWSCQNFTRLEEALKARLETFLLKLDLQAEDKW